MTPIVERFWRLVQRNSGCWLWVGYTDPDGYGRMGSRLAHRVAFELFVGPIPDGLQIDHVCHSRDPACEGGRNCVHRACVNPEHLELVTANENVRRGVRAARTHCPQGHPYDEANTYVCIYPNTLKRNCRACNRARVAARQARLRMGSAKP